ncbi:MAG: 4-hydroxyproline epimerase [Saprospiraceae bacterium]
MKKDFYCIDAHTCGNPVRLVAGGGPILKGKTIADKRIHFLKEFDWIRKGLMFEPRGHDMMSGSILYPPADEENDIAVLFIETSGCLPMCGHKHHQPSPLRSNTAWSAPKHQAAPHGNSCGIGANRIRAGREKVKWVRLTNIASFLHSTELTVDCPGLGVLVVDVAYGGNFYAIVDPQKNFKGIEHHTAGELIAWSPILRKQLNEKYEFVHPEDERINGLSHLLWTGKTISPEAHGRNAVFYGDKAIDRSPCGTGTSSRMAQWAAKGKLKIGDPFIHESIIGSQFIGRVEAAAKVRRFRCDHSEYSGVGKNYGVQPPYY